jgi:hypothetical protein
MSDYGWLTENPGFRKWMEDHKPEMAPLVIKVTKLGEDRLQASVAGVEGAESARSSLTASVFTAAGEALQILGRKMVHGDPAAIDRGMRLFEVEGPPKEPG